ncbi:MAG: 2Fe-2S iron-sulfur cluster-binding protein [Puniceicoccaceae bacterium]
MSDNAKPNTVVVNVDGMDVEVPSGVTMIEAAAAAGKEVPHYCYHPKLSVAGNCRMCLVEMGMPMRDRATGEPILDEDGKQKIGWMPKPAIACNSKVSPGLHIKTNTKLVEDCRHGVMEFLLVNHPLDCPICDQAGECRLQEFATEYGRGYSRFVEEKNSKPKRTVLGPRVMLDDERCILCSRCVRFMQEIPKEDVLGFVDRGSYSTLTCYPGHELDSNYSLNTVDICPVGALTSRDFRFKMRVWFLRAVKSICTESSVGANTEVWSREGKIYRITPRRNDEVNDTWMTDSGRALYTQVEASDRPRNYLIDGEVETLAEVVAETSRTLAEGKIGWIVSAFSTVEEQGMIAELVGKYQGKVFARSHLGEEDGILLSADRSPNMRGLFLHDLISEYPTGNLDPLGEAIDRGEVTTIFAIHDNLEASGLTEAQLGKVRILYAGSKVPPPQATVVIPTLTVFEKAGSFVNQQFRLQRFERAVPGPEGIVEDCAFLGALLAGLEVTPAPIRDASAAWSIFSSKVPELHGISFRSIGDLGLSLPAARFKHLSFPERKTLKFDSSSFFEAIAENEVATANA